MSETPETIIARALNQMGGRAGFCNELAVAIITALEASGYRVVKFTQRVSEPIEITDEDLP